jgi:YD repeat-containing protein
MLLMSGAFTEATWKEYGDQYLAPKVQSTENKVPPSAPPQSYESQMQFDTAGNAKSVNVGALAWSTKFDQAGNVTSAQEPGLRGTHAMSYNAVGAVTTETLADGTSQQSHAYNATGSSTAFNDPTHEATGVTPDNLGRPLIINYKDNTSQQIKYDGARVVAVKDRQDRWQSFTYTGGHVTDIWNSETPDSGAANHLDHIDYDNAGRVIHSTTPDVKVDYDTLTLDGLPQHTRQTRFKDHSGFGTQQELDHFDQTHHYNGHGERTSYSVPGGGAPGWSANVTIGYDAMGNIESLTTDGGLQLTGDYRAAGRPNSRTITLPATNNASKKLLRTYRYKNDTGQLEEMRATIDVAFNTRMLEWARALLPSKS